MPKTMKQLLTEIRDTIADKKNWTQGSNARNKYGDPSPVHSSETVCFCLTGAAAKVAGESNPTTDFHNMWNELKKFLPLGFYTIPQFNDSVTHSEVIRFLNKAIDAQP